jgi:hypothetical protein
MPLKLMPLRKAYHADCIHHIFFCDIQVQEGHTGVYVLVLYAKTGKVAATEAGVCDRLTLLDSYAKDAAGSECDDNS